MSDDNTKGRHDCAITLTVAMRTYATSLLRSTLNWKLKLVTLVYYKFIILIIIIFKLSNRLFSLPICMDYVSSDITTKQQSFIAITENSLNYISIFNKIKIYIKGKIKVSILFIKYILYVHKKMQFCNYFFLFLVSSIPIF